MSELVAQNSTYRLAFCDGRLYRNHMFGPSILVRALDRPAVTDKHGNKWRYHSRSDRHSKVACWGILFDLLCVSSQLRAHAESGTVAFGINHEMADFTMNRRKNLDLVICTPRTQERSGSLMDLADRYELDLLPDEKKMLSGLPDVQRAPVGSVRVALEAKACMTAHQRALPRLYDELNSSQLTIHGNSSDAIAVGYVLVNSGVDFVSSDLNRRDLSTGPPEVSRHRQPRDAQLVVDKVKQIPRRSRTRGDGFDALAISVIEFDNAIKPAKLVDSSPAPVEGDIFHYDSMIHRVAQAYDSRFR